jgi:putative N-acetylmannosamine-6-phosphate epimerase
MTRTYQLLRDGPTLIVSLPDNSLDLARAAEAGGAHALKVHINVHHDASGTHFGSLEQERPRLEAIQRAVSLPIGVVPGVTDPLRRDEVEALAEMGFDFIDTFAHRFPSWLLGMTRMTRAMAIDSTYTVEAAAGLPRIGMEILEAAVIPHSEYGQPLTAADLALYARLAQAVATPIIVPSQRRFEPHDVELIAGAGVNGIMIGAIVTGLEPASIEAAARQFRAAIDALA